MEKRTFITTLGIMIMGGCVGSPENSGNTNTPTTSSTTTHANETTTEKRTHTTRVAPKDRLTIISRLESEQTFRIKLVQESNSEVVYDKTHTFGANDSLKLDDYFDPGENYKFFILKDSEQVFDYLIGYNAGIEVTIFSENDIEVTSITEA